jgi:hypothetical protein
MTDQPGVRLGIAGGVLFVATGAAVALHLPHGYAAAALLILTLLCCPVLPRAGAVFLGISGWAMTTGFVENDLGQLTFASHDLLRLRVYVGATALGAGRARAPQCRPGSPRRRDWGRRREVAR